jgi:hypothetical protein
MTQTSMERFGELQQRSTREFAKVREAAVREAQDQGLLDLCLARVEEMLTGTVWREPADLGERDRDYLDFAEQFCFAVSNVSDEQVDRLLEHDSPEFVCAFIGSLYALEISRRVEIVGGAVLR